MAKFAVITAVVVLALLGLFWVGSEMHYRNCVDAATASTPAPKPEPDLIVEGEETDVSRQRAVDACSRLPF